MNRNKLNVNYELVTNYKATCLDESGDLSVITEGMAILMITTGMYRLNSKEDIPEFIYRIAVLMQELKIVDGFFVNDDILLHMYDGLHAIPVRPADVQKFLGLYWKIDERNTPRTEWENKLDKHWNNTQIITAMRFAGSLFAPNINIDGLSVRLKRGGEIKISPEIRRGAEIVAEKSMETFSHSSYKHWLRKNKRALNKISDKITKKEAFMKTPKKLTFDFDQIPQQGKEKIMQHFKRLFSYDETVNWDSLKKEKALVYLCWLMANDLASTDGLDVFVDPRYEFDDTYYELPDGGYNYEELMLLYELDEIIPILKEA